jgi:phage baseplate assembly protein W
MPERDKFLGRGWSFPPSFTRRGPLGGAQRGSIDMVEAKEDIDQSLQILLSTSLGERIMQPKYGCNLKDYQFEPMSATLIGQIKDLVTNAILYYEARIKLESVSVSTSGSEDAIEGKLRIEVAYSIRATNSRYNYVYDFYLKEASTL